MAGIFEAVLGSEVLKSLWYVGLILIFVRYCLSHAFDGHALSYICSRMVSRSLSGKKSVPGHWIAGMLRKMRISRQCAEGVSIAHYKGKNYTKAFVR